MPKNEIKTDYDVIIVGAGAAGLTAALYAARRNLRVLVVTQDIGGQAATTEEIENYPGYELIEGPNLMKKFRQQAESHGAKIIFDEVTSVENTGEKYNDIPVHKIVTKDNEWRAYAVILAFGMTRRHLGVPGEDDLHGKGVVYNADAEASKYKGETVAVIGGGNSAAQAVLKLAEICTKVYLVHRRDEFKAENVLMERMKNHKNIELKLTCEVERIHGKNGVEKITLVDCNDTNKKEDLEVKGVFIEVGFIIKKDIVHESIETDKRGQIIISPDNETSVAGIFAAGDITNITYKQVVISAGEGATAALTAYKYLQSHGLAKGTYVDWGLAKK